MITLVPNATYLHYPIDYHTTIQLFHFQLFLGPSDQNLFLCMIDIVVQLSNAESNGLFMGLSVYFPED